MADAAKLALILGLASGPAQAVETVRIAMGEMEEVTVSARALAYGSDSEEGDFVPMDKERASVRIARAELQVNGAPWRGDAVRFRGTASDEIRVASLRVRGDVVVRRAHGQLQLINVISLEDYLVGVLGSEMPHDFPEEALKAQAVAARTYALNKKIAASDQPYHLGSSVLHQVYGGLSREDARARAAVNATRGEVLTYNLEPIEAYFHASCGGRTESGLAALNRDLPYLKSVECPCGRLHESHWELELSRSELKSELGTGEDVTLSMVSRSHTGRAKELRVSPASVIDAASFRQRLGYSRLKSLWFDLEREEHSDEVKITGRGYGHGAGLCQWGARLYAKAGWNYRQILMHYYAGVDIQTLY